MMTRTFNMPAITKGMVNTMRPRQVILLLCLSRKCRLSAAISKDDFGGMTVENRRFHSLTTDYAVLGSMSVIGIFHQVTADRAE
jgi:hypothetical protein